VNSSDLKSLVVLPTCQGVRRASLAAGAVTALFTGGVPLIGLHSIVMGRAVLLPAAFAFVLHLAVSLVYGAVFSVALARSRNGWTLLASMCVTLLLYFANSSFSYEVRLPLAEFDALVAHLIFGFTFTALFKLGEIGVRD
jgi:hypothetical protein